MEITRCSVKRRSRRSNNSTGSDNNNIEIPMDLIFNILSRLPVKPLLRFKSVCKTWYALIQNPSFIKTHHTMTKRNLNNNNNPTLPSLLVANYDFETMMYSMWLQSRDETRHLIYSFKLNCCPRVLGVCDGMICATCDFGIIICNPTTGGPICKIPRFNLSKVKESDDEFFGFGGLQTPDNNYDYKLFRIICSSHLNLRGAEVYSMSTGIWREIEVTTGANIDPRPDQYPFGVLCSPPVAINEVFYWRAYVNRLLSVMCFDMSGYVFDMIAGPEKLGSGCSLSWEIVDFKGKLALATCRYSCYNLFEMWVFSKKERSWTMKLSTKDFASTSMLISILGYGRNNNLVMLQHSSDAEEKKLFTYDTESLDIVYYNLMGLKKCHNVYLYTESLLLV